MARLRASYKAGGGHVKTFEVLSQWLFRRRRRWGHQSHVCVKRSHFCSRTTRGGSKIELPFESFQAATCFPDDGYSVPLG